MLQEIADILPNVGMEKVNFSITWDDSGINTRGQHAVSPFSINLSEFS